MVVQVCRLLRAMADAAAQGAQTLAQVKATTGFTRGQQAEIDALLKTQEDVARRVRRVVDVQCPVPRRGR